MNQFLRFITVGIINTAGGYLLIYSFMYFLGWPPELSNFIGYIVALSASYGLHRVYTFRSVKKKRFEIVMYFSIFAIAYSLNLAALSIMIRWFDWNSYLSQIFAGMVYVVISYYLNHYIVFSNKLRFAQKME